MTNLDIDEARKAIRCLAYKHEHLETGAIAKIAPLLDELERLREARALAPGEVAVPAADIRAVVEWLSLIPGLGGTKGLLGELKARLRALVEEVEA